MVSSNPHHPPLTLYSLFFFAGRTFVIFQLGRRDQWSGARSGTAAKLFFLLLGVFGGRRFLGRVDLLLSPVQLLPTQADLALGGVDTQHLDFDLVSHLDDFLRAFDFMFGKFRDM